MKRELVSSFRRFFLIKVLQCTSYSETVLECPLSFAAFPSCKTAASTSLPFGDAPLPPSQHEKKAVLSHMLSTFLPCWVWEMETLKIIRSGNGSIQPILPVVSRKVRSKGILHTPSLCFLKEN